MVLLRAQTKPERLQISLCFSLAFKLGDADDLIASQSLVWTERGRGRAREGSRSQIPAAIPFKSHLRLSTSYSPFQNLNRIFNTLTSVQSWVYQPVNVDLFCGQNSVRSWAWKYVREDIQSAPKVVSQPSRPSLSLPLATHRSHSQNHLNQPGCALQECR